MATVTAPSVITPAPTSTIGLQETIASLQTVILQAQADIASPITTDAQKTAARQMLAYATSAQQSYQALLTPSSPAIYVVGEGDSLFLIAQAYLGDPTRYVEIQQDNGFRGLAIQPGMVLTLPQP